MLAGLAGLGGCPASFGAGLAADRSRGLCDPRFRHCRDRWFIVSILVGTYLALTNRDMRTPEPTMTRLLTMGIIGAGTLAGFLASSG